MNKRLLGVIDATTYINELEDLISSRSLAAVPFAGRYRLIDFILSSMVNSRIKNVSVFPTFQYRSLMDHLGTGRNWDLNRKRDGIFIFPPQYINGLDFANSSFHQFAANLDYFERSTQEYVVVANCFTVANIDFRKVLETHIESKNDITVIRHEGKSLDMYVLRRTLLIELVENRVKTGYTCMRDVVTAIHPEYEIGNYSYKGYAVMIDSIKKYYSTSIELLQPQTWKSLFLKEQPIFTKVMDEPPTRYSQGAKINNSMVANGCQINGKVENSIIARGVKIGKNTVIRNSVILQKCEIADNCEINNVIVDRDVKIESGRIIKASSHSPQVIRRETVQGALMSS